MKKITIGMFSLAALVGMTTISAQTVRAFNNNGSIGEATLDLGLLPQPGPALRNKRFELSARGKLRFRVLENQISCLRALNAAPEGVLKTARRIIEARPEEMLGNSDLSEYTLEVAQETKPGTLIVITTVTCFQSRDNPDWAFSFELLTR